MWFFQRKKKSAVTEKTIQAIHHETFEKIDKATQSIDKNTASLDKLTALLEDKNIGTTEAVFLATPGGGKFSKGNKK